MAREAVIVGAVRTAIGKRNGALSQTHAADLGGHVLRELGAPHRDRPGGRGRRDLGLRRPGRRPVGQHRPLRRARGRVAGVRPRHHDQPGLRVVSQQALEFGFAGVISGAYDVVVAGGVEVMSRVPLGATRQGGFPYGPAVMERYDNFEFNQGEGAELIAERWGLLARTGSTSTPPGRTSSPPPRSTRARSTRRSPGDRTRRRRWRDTLSSTVDEGLRRGTSPETLARLKPSFRADGVIHAGNSSQISDGAAALLITSPGAGGRAGPHPDRPVLAGAVAGADPVLHADRPDPRHREAAEEVGRRTRRHRRLRDQRGVRVRAARLAGRDRRRLRPAEPPRRRDRARPSARRPPARSS